VKGEIRTVRRVGEDGEWVLTTVYVIDGREVPKAEFDRAMKKPKRAGFMAANSKWPILSKGLGVHPKQVKAATAAAAKKGVRLEFTPSGEAILESRAHRREALRATGFHDNNGGYGDG
jgi:hypothetical protein